MQKILLLLLVLSLAFSPSLKAADEARLLRFPATNGTDIVFSYAGDLYKVPVSGGQAVRLTSHVGYEMFPKFSPDGRTIAFTGQYDGNTEVYTIPADGGEPLRITYTPTNARDDLGDRMGPNNIVTGWTPDGQHIVYRNRISNGFAGKLYLVNKEGGLSEPIPLPEGGFNSWSPDGKKLAYNRVMREFRTWKYYRGGMADDVWVYDPEEGSVTNITESRSQDIQPMWIGDDIFFISDRDRTMNLFVYNTVTGETEKVTDFTEYDIKFPSAGGNTIVFENGGYIYKMDADTRRPEKVDIYLTSDNIYARSEIKDGADYITAISLSPDGSRLAVTTRGEVFSVPAEKGVTKNIARSPGAHDRDAQWSPDGKWIAYISDGTGETELYIQDAAGGEPVQLTRGNDTYIRTFQWSPDSRKIVYTDRKNRVVLVDTDLKEARTAVTAPAGEPMQVSFSPDGKWLTYVRIAENRHGIIYLYNIAEGREYPVTDKWYSSYTPVFSTDGKYLVFTSARDFDPTYDVADWNYTYNNKNGVYLALLDKDTPSPFLMEDAAVSIENNEKDSKKTDDKNGIKKEEAPVTVKFDPEGITERIIKLPVVPGNYRNFHSDGTKVIYTIGRTTKMYDLRKQKEEEVVDGVTFFEPGRKKAWVLADRKYYVTDIPTGKITLDKPVDLSNMKITTDYSAEWAQIYNEGWRIMRDGFYVENMHGVDWEAMKRKYEVLLPYVKNRHDLTYVIGELIGELNVGHAYINTGEAHKPDRIPLGLLGAEVSRHPETGFFRLDKILEGASWSKELHSPLTEPGIEAEVGEYIVAIDGVPTNSVKDMYSLLVGKAGIPTEISLNKKAQLDGARKIVISPLSEEHSLYHYNWVQNNLRKVEEASGGKIGYIYIPDMGVDGLNEFARYFYPQLDKEGVIIDDRANGGGNVSPMILERLAREPYRLTMRRNSNLIGTIPQATLVGPKVTLINKYSASDGDLFPYGFRALGLGKLIGTRTWGGIVGINASLPFIDGTDMRVPTATSLSIDGQWIIENEGVEPDIWVDNDPVKEWNGEDEQLDRAIEEILKELENRRPVPEMPAPRVWNE